MKEWMPFVEWYLINNPELCKQLIWLEKHPEENKKYGNITIKKFRDMVNEMYKKASQTENK